MEYGGYTIVSALFPILFNWLLEVSEWDEIKKKLTLVTYKIIYNYLHMITIINIFSKYNFLSGLLWKLLNAKGRVQKKSGNFPTRVQDPPPPKSGKDFSFFIWYMVSKKHFCAKKSFLYFLWLVPLVLGVGALKIRDPSLNLGVGTPNIGNPSPM